MNVVVLATSFPRFTGDGAGRFVLDLSRGLAERGHRLIHVVPEAADAPEREEVGEGLAVHRVRFARLRAWRKLVYGGGIGANLRAAPWLALGIPSLLRALERETLRAIEAAGADALLTHWVFPAGVLGARLRDRTGVRHVGVAHGGGAQLLARPGLRRWLARWADGTDAALFVSEDLRRKALDALGREAWRGPSVVQPMGIDPARFASPGHRAATRQELGVGPAGFLVLGVGRLIPLKGYDLLLDAAAGLDGVHVVLAGDGPEREALRRRGSAQGVDLRLEGAVPPERLALLYEAADLVCIPSRLGSRGRSEGSPMVAAESFAAGRPVLASRSGGLAEVVQDGENGLTFAVDSVAKLRRGLLALRGDAGLLARVGAGALAAAPRFDYRLVARTVEALLLADDREVR